MRFDNRELWNTGVYRNLQFNGKQQADFELCPKLRLCALSLTSGFEAGEEQ